VASVSRVVVLRVLVVLRVGVLLLVVVNAKVDG
jgi:hypothetical protein